MGPTKAPYHDAASRPDDQATTARGAPIAGRIGVRQGLAVLVAAQALALWLLGRASFFRTDDWIYFSEMHKQGRFSEDWLTSIWWKHIAPLHRGMFTLLDHATPAAYTWALLFEIAMVALAAVAFYGVVELLFGRSWWLLIPVALLGFSFNFALPLVWPSSGFQAMPETAFSIVCLYAYLRHLKSGRIAWAVVAAVALGIGLCFYIRPLLMLPLLLVLRFLFLESSLRPSAILRALWREKLTWAILLVPAAVFLYMYFHRDAFGQRQPLNLTDLQHYVREAWFRNVFPAALGVRELPGTLDARHLAAEVAGQLVLLGLVALSFWRKGIEALRGWAFMLIAIALTFGLTATGKLAESGVAIGLETRYVTNLTWLVPLGALMALHPRAVAQLGAPWPTDTEVAPRRPLPAWAPHAGILAAVTLTLVSCGLALGGSHRIIKEWGAQPGRSWVKNALASLKGFEARGDVPRLPDALVPPSVVDPAFAAYAWRHTVLPELGEPVATAPPYNALQQPDGTVVPARVKPKLRLSLTAPDASAQLTGLKHDGVCLGATDAAEGLIVWTLPRAVQGPMVIASLSAPGRVPKQGVPIDVDSGFGLPVTTLHVIQPVGEPTIDTGETNVVRLRLHVAPGQRICASSLAVGVLAPTA